MKRGMRIMCAWLLIALSMGVCAWGLWRYRERGVEVMRNSSTQTLDMMAALKRDDDVHHIDDMLTDMLAIKAMADAGDSWPDMRSHAASLGFDGIELTRSGDMEQLRFTKDGRLAFTSQTAMGRLTCYVGRDRLAEVFDVPANEDRYYSFIVDSTGEILTPVNHDGFLDISTNTLAFYSEAVLYDGVRVEDVAEAIKNGVSGSLTYSYGSRSNNVCWKPLGMNDWTLFLVASSHLTDEARRDIDRRVFELGVTLAIGVLVLIASFMLLMNRMKDRLVRLRAKLDESAEVSQTLNAISFTILFQCDLSTGDIFYNDSFERQLGRKPVITNISMLLEGEYMPALKTMAGEMRRGVPKGKASVQLRHANGALIWYQIYYVCVYGADKTKPVKIVGRIANIEWHEHEQDTQLAIVERDALTGLLGHTAFMRHAQNALLSNRDSVAMMIIDIDDFKVVSQSPDGYHGDEFIVKMSDAIRKIFPSGAMMGRISGDIFAVMVTASPTREILAKRAGALEAEFGRTGQTCSIGIVVSDDTVNSIAELFARADKALYRAKLLGKHGHQFFNATYESDDTTSEMDDVNVVLLKCVVSIATEKSLDDALHYTLRKTAQFYDASCAYVLIADEEKRRFSETNIYRREKNGETGMLEFSFDEAPVLTKAFEEHKPISIVDNESSKELSAGDIALIRRRGERSVYLVPLGDSGARLGFLGVASPKYHVGSVTFLKTLAICIGAQIQKRKT